jgi:hypothetical protein
MLRLNPSVAWSLACAALAAQRGQRKTTQTGRGKEPPNFAGIPGLMDVAITVYG